MLRNRFEVKYLEHAPVGGGQFSLGPILDCDDSFGMAVSIENTGEQGRLELLLDGCRAFGLNPEQAQTWVKDYPRLRARDATGREIVERGFASYSLTPGPRSNLPRVLEIGQVWEGTIESPHRALNVDTEALIIFLAPYKREGQRALQFFVSHDATRPFIGLRQEVQVQAYTGAKLLVNQALATLRAQWNGLWKPESLGMVGGVVAGSIAALSTDTDLKVPFSLGGALVGLLGVGLFRRYRIEKP